MSNQHYFASCVYGWACDPESHEMAVAKLVKMFQHDIKKQIRGLQSEGHAGFYVWSCRVLAPMDAEYKIEFYAPKGVDTDEGREHVVTRVTAKGCTFQPNVELTSVNFKDLKAA